MKKQYVLWVVHTDLSNPGDEGSSRHVYSKEKLNLDIHFENFRKKFQLDKSWHELHVAGVINAMKEAQQLGMLVVYDNMPRGGKRFLVFAGNHGVNVKEVIFVPHSYIKTILAKLFMIRPGLKKEDFEFVLAGHFADACVKKVADSLRIHRFNPYLLVGTPTDRTTGTGHKELKAIYGKNRLITIHQLKHLK